MNGTRKHPLCKTCGAQIPEHLHNSARHCSKGCIYRSRANIDGRTPLIDPDARFWNAVQRGAESDCWEWQSTTNQGYGVIALNGRGGGMTLAHRHSYALANGPIPAGGHILHSCDNPPCVNPSHLRLGDHDANMQDMAVRERGGKTKLTASKVVEIRQAHAAGESQRSVAARYGVSQSNIAFITLRKTWKHVA